MDIVLTDPMSTDAYCCEAHPGYPLHVITDCTKLEGVEPFTRDHRCSTCDLHWSPDVLETQHSGCRTLFIGKDGSERSEAGRPLLRVKRAGEWVGVTYGD